MTSNPRAPRTDQPSRIDRLTPLITGAVVLIILSIWLLNPDITSGVTWPVAFVLSTLALCGTGLAGWRMYLRERYTDDPED